MENNTGIERSFGWDDEIEVDNGEFILLEPGEYDFEIASFERGRYEGGAKLPPCNMAIIDVKIITDKGTANIQTRLFLHTKTEGLLSAFFTSIGQKKKGERVRMNWQAVVGSTGRCKVTQRKWVGKDGEEHVSNDIKQFLPPQESSSKPSFTPGAF